MSPEPTTVAMGAPAASCCEIITDFDRVGEIMPAWDRLWRSSQDAAIFLSPGWLLAWWDAFGAPGLLRMVVAWNDGRLAGALPLVKSDGVLRFLGPPMSDYMDALCEEKSAGDVLPVLVEAVRSQLSEGGCILQNLSQDSMLVRHMARCVPDWNRDMQLLPSSTYPIIGATHECDGIFDELVHKPCLRRPNNKFCKAGSAVFRHVRSTAEAALHLQQFFEEHAQRHALMGQKSSLLAPGPRKFIRGLVEKLDLDRELRFAVLELDGVPVAHSIGFEVEHKFLMYQQAFAVDYWDYSPGDVLLRYLLQYAKQAAIQRYDFGRGRESFKTRFANQERRTFTLYIEPSVRGRSFRRCSRSLECRMRGFVKQHPLMLQGLRKLRNRAPANLEAEKSRIATERRDVLSLLWKSITGPPYVYYRVAGGMSASESAGTKCSSVTLKSRLSDLAALLLKRGHLLTNATLREFRNRLRHGQRFYLNENADKVQLAWVRTASGRDLGAEARSNAGGTIVVYDFLSFPYTAPATLAIVPDCLHLVSAQNPGAEVWVQCRRNDKLLQRAITLAGCSLQDPPGLVFPAYL